MTDHSAASPFPRIAVAGSLNIDRIWQVPVFPQAGETVIAHSPREEFGGKGANQAVAAARQGASVTFIGAVGTDTMAERYREHLEQESICTRNLRFSTSASTGSAHVYLTPDAENMIVVEPGANRTLCAETIESALRSLHAEGKAPTVFLTQFECPVPAVVHGITVAAELGIPTVLNASPVNKELRWGEFVVDTVIVNEHECSHWFGRSPEQLRLDSADATASLLERFRIRNLIVTRGSEPTFFFSATLSLSVPPVPVSPVDTVGAGDTFAGALAVQIAMGTEPAAAIAHANAAAALATLSLGAQTAMPSRQKVLRFLQKSGENQP